MNRTLKTYIPLILFTVLTNFVSQILLKKGMTSIAQFDISVDGLVKSGSAIVFNPFVFFGLVVMVISMASHLVVLSRVDISFAYPFLGLSFVLITLYGAMVLSEPLNLWKIAGVGFIVLGVSLVAQS